MVISKNILEKIKNDDEIILQLMRATKRSYPTIMRWINESNEHLTTAAALEIICIGLKITREEALTH